MSIRDGAGSNFGTCVGVLAPGDCVSSSSSSGRCLTGSSAAAAVVGGVAALVLRQHAAVLPSSPSAPASASPPLPLAYDDKTVTGGQRYVRGQHSMNVSELRRLLSGKNTATAAAAAARKSSIVLFPHKQYSPMQSCEGIDLLLNTNYTFEQL